MPDVTISSLPAAGAFAEADLLPVVQATAAGSATRRASLTQLRGALLPDRPLHVRDYGARGDGVTDDAAAIQAAIDAAAEQGGGTVQLGPKRYLVAGAELDIRPNVTLAGGISPGAQRAEGDYRAVPYTLLLDPARTIRLRRNAGLVGVAVIRRGLAPPATLREALTMVAGFAGTAVTIGDGTNHNGSDARAESLLILGFDQAVRSVYNARVQLRDIAGDNRNGIRLEQSYDISRLRGIHFWPFLTGNLSNLSLVSRSVSGLANNGAGLIRVTTAEAHGLATGDVVNLAGCQGLAAANGRFTVTVVSATTVDLQGSTHAAGYVSGGMLHIWANRRTGTAFHVENADVAELVDCFAYGYDVGFRLGSGAAAVQCVNCSADNHPGIADPATVGLHLTGNAFRTKWIGGFLSSQGRTVLLDTSSSEQNQIVGAVVNGGVLRTLDVQSGALTLEACDLTPGPSLDGATYPNLVYMGAGAVALTLVGTELRTATFAGASDAALRRIAMLGNRGATVAAQVTGGTVELATIPSAAEGPTRRLEIAADGTVTLRRRSASLGARLNLANAGDQGAYVLSVGPGAANLGIGGDPTLNPNGGIDLGASNNATAPTRVNIRRISTTPAAGDRLGQISFNGMNAAGAETVFGTLAVLADAVAGGAESGSLVLELRQGGTSAQRLRIAPDGTVTLAGPLVLAADPAAAMQAATRQYVDGQFTERRMARLVLAAATALTQASHNARMLIANPGTSLSLDWAATGDGFSCLVVNRSGADLPVTLANFSGAIVNSEGHTKIKANGVASLLVYSPDGGTTRLCHLTGAGVA
ncbi:hypothetical protein LPC08_02390 [Roseomonas sp. OT10]|uniref:glycosyl hydrolase family 28-related protein n=1 Tax=Roseomonas cutis TaxID=2897332 RepID=UPI001E5E37C0|nr:glycosyl hydrolase family 28-related protein [Roseomonas sp. OT10]UFN49516.1 hypothetical protein LPC08_02390 [Roseomonas sp. OT10]